MAASAGADGKVESIVMFPFMAQGHIIPFLSLAFEIEQRSNYEITFVNTPLNINKLRNSIPPNTCNIRFVELAFSSIDHGLPPDSENTDSLPYPLICHLLEASETLKPLFNQLILDMIKQQHGRRPLCIIADMFFGWSVEIANQFNIFHSIFQTCSAYGSATWSSVWYHLPHLKTSSLHFSLPDFPEVSSIHISQLPNNLRLATGTDKWSVILHRLLPFWWKTDAVLVNTMEELDHIGLNYYRKKTGNNKPVWPILPTLCYSQKMKKKKKDKPITRSQTKSGINLQQCLEWLDNRPPASVVFVSFGSQNTISPSQLMELAIGLETSGKNFIWVVRPPVGFDINGEFTSEWLPNGFEHRIKQGNKGLIVHKWAPQLEILSHSSTCAFLSHCGWNSVLESLSNGVPIISWPLSSEQFFNSKLLEEEVGVCVEVARGNVSQVEHKEIIRVIELVMGDTHKGRDMKNKATRLQNMIQDAITQDQTHKGSSINNLDHFISTALSATKTELHPNIN